MAANTTLTVTDLDFDSIKTNLKTFLRSQSRFQDFDFEGSGMGVLLDLLAYNTHYNAYYLNMIANEMFLDTSKLRQSTVSHAKLINYVPESSHGAETKVNIRVTPPVGNTLSSFTIDKYTRFLGASIDGINYPFVTLNSNTAFKDDGVSFAFSNVVIKQGEVVTRQFLMEPSNTKRRFEIPSNRVDLNTLSVTIQESASNTQTYVYTVAEDLTEITRDSQIYFVEENEDGNYRIIFGDDVIGKKPANGNIINITYVDTAGSIANKINVFSIGETITFSNVLVNSTGASYSGTEKETIEQVKYRAPYYYSAQNRAITTYDYETLITKDYPNIDSVAVWGGEDNIPVIYGKVFLSLKTKEGYFLSNLEKENIKDTLIENRNVLTVSPEIVDPSYTFILIRGTIYYQPTATQNDAAAIRNIVNASIEDYKTDYLGRFKSTFKKSVVQKYIEDSESSITGSDIKVIIQKRIPITLSQSKNYTVDFGIPIKKGDFNSSISSYPSLGIVDSNFVTRQVYFEEVPSIASGIERIDIINGGINYTTTPTVTITGDGTGAVGVAKLFGGRVVSIQLLNQGQNYTRASISISGDTGTGVVVQPILQSRVGTLRTYYYNTSGEKVFVNKNAGTIDYNNGIVVLKSVLPVSVASNSYYEPNVLTINTFVDKEIIESVRNKILDIDVDNPLSFQTEIVSV
jgi:uncharacterized protein YbcV (DUF1398 family)